MDSFEKCVPRNPQCKGKVGGFTQRESSEIANALGCDTRKFTEDVKDTLSDKLSCLQLILQSKCYTGPSDLKLDVEGRVEIMKEAVEAAYRKATNESNTLKLFVAPEFFFRGPDGSYDLASILPYDNGTYSPIDSIARGLEDIVADERFVDWMFVFGTVIASDVKEDGKVEFFNFSPVYKGYDPKITGKSVGMQFIVPKTSVSSIDFLTSDRRPDPNSPQLYDNPKLISILDALEEEYGYTPVKNNMLSMNGILMGIEICLDHAENALRRSFGNWTKDPASVSIPGGGVPGSITYPYDQLEPPGLPQVQIITSAGMSITESSAFVGDAGIVVLQDGGAPCDKIGQVLTRDDWFSTDIAGIPYVKYGTFDDQSPDRVRATDSDVNIARFFNSQDACLNVFSPAPLGDIMFPPPPSCPPEKSCPSMRGCYRKDPGCSCAKPRWNSRSKQCQLPKTVSQLF